MRSHHFGAVSILFTQSSTCQASLGPCQFGKVRLDQTQMCQSDTKISTNALPEIAEKPIPLSRLPILPTLRDKKRTMVPFF
jgi:hypothetical protein